MTVNIVFFLSFMFPYSYWFLWWWLFITNSGDGSKTIILILLDTFWGLTSIYPSCPSYLFGFTRGNHQPPAIPAPAAPFRAPWPPRSARGSRGWPLEPWNWGRPSGRPAWDGAMEAGSFKYDKVLRLRGKLKSLCIYIIYIIYYGIWCIIYIYIYIVDDVPRWCFTNGGNPFSGTFACTHTSEIANIYVIMSQHEPTRFDCGPHNPRNPQAGPLIHRSCVRDVLLPHALQDRSKAIDLRQKKVRNSEDSNPNRSDPSIEKTGNQWKITATSAG